MPKYIDIDSTYRNRNQYSNPDDFIIPVYLNQSLNNFYDPILISAPFTGSTKPITDNVTQFSVDGFNITLDSAEPEIPGFYKNNNLQIGNEFHKIIRYNGTTKVATLDTEFASVPSIGTHYTIRKAGSYFKTNVLLDGDSNIINSFNILNRTPSMTPGIYNRSFFIFDNGPLVGKTALITEYIPDTTKSAWNQLDISGSSSIVPTTKYIGFIFSPTTTGYLKTITITFTAYESVLSNRTLTLSIVNGTNINSSPIFSTIVNVSNNTNPTDITYTFNTNTILYFREYYILRIIDSTNNGINTGFTYIYGISNTYLYSSINTPTYPKLSIGMLPIIGDVAYTQPTLNGAVNILPTTTVNTYDMAIINNNGYTADKIVTGNYSRTNILLNSLQGFSVAVSNNKDIIIWGAPSDNENVGSAWYYDNLLNKNHKITPTNTIGNSNFGCSIDISDDASIIAIGGNADNNIGAVWIYSNQVYTDKILPTNFTGNPAYGQSLKLNSSGNMLVVGGNTNVGKIWIYEYTTSWILLYDSNISDNIGNSNLGYSVDISDDGNTVVAGGYLDNSGIGAVWVFQYSLGTYNSTKLIPTLNFGNCNFGTSVSLQNDYLAIGGPTDTENGGAVWIFQNISGWLQSTKITTTDPLNSRAGTNVRLNSATNLLVYSDPNYNTNIGIIKNFSRVGNTWVNSPNTTQYTNNGNNFAKSINTTSSNNYLVSGNTIDTNSNLYVNNLIESKYIFTFNNNFLGTYSNKYVYEYIVPPQTSSMSVKLWGGGGATTGGSGGYVFVSISVSQGDIFYITVGGGGSPNTTRGQIQSGGVTHSPDDSATGGNSNTGTDVALGGVFGAGGGGQYSAIHKFVGGNYILIACAGGGGGGSVIVPDYPNFGTTIFNYGGGAGESVNGAIAGNNGTGGSGDASANYDPNATTTGVSVLSDSGGIGSDGFIYTSDSLCGGGGGGYGGGSSFIDGIQLVGIGAGGGNYIPSVAGIVTSSSGTNGNNGALSGTDYFSETLPPNSNDVDYGSNAGVGGSITTDGGNGRVVINLNNNGTIAFSTDFGSNFSTPVTNYPQSNNVYNSDINTFVIPNGVFQLRVKLWGAGGGSSGGSGGYSEVELNVNPGETYYLTVGGGGGYEQYVYGTYSVIANGGNNSNPDDSAIGGYGIVTNGDQFAFPRVGGGGQYSAIHKFESGKYYLIACAGGGGGGGESQFGTYNGAGANNSLNDAGGGNNGIGGISGNGGNNGQNYDSSATTTGVSSLALMGGNGANGINTVKGVSAGGGGGYGGGATSLNDFGGGGGGNYSPPISGNIINSLVINGNNGSLTGDITYPPNYTDPDYTGEGGVGGGKTQTGFSGLIIIYYGYTTRTFGSNSITMSGDGKYIDCIDINNPKFVNTSSDYGATFNYTNILCLNGTITNVTKSGMSYDGQYRVLFDNAIQATFFSNDYGSTYTINNTIYSDVCSDLYLSPRGMFGVMGIFDKVYTTNDYGNTWTQLSLGNDITNFFNTNGGVTSVCISDDGDYITLVCSSRINYSTDSGNSWNQYDTAITLTSVSMNFNGQFQTVSGNLPNDTSIIGYFTNDFATTFIPFGFYTIPFATILNSLSYYGSSISASGKYMYVSGPNITFSNTFGTINTFDNLNNSCYSTGVRSIVCNSGLSFGNINSGTISIFDSNYITQALFDKLQMVLTSYSSTSDRVLRFGISLNGTNVYSVDLTVSQPVITPTLTDFTLNYTLTDFTSALQLTIQDVSGDTSGFVNVYGIVPTNVYISNSNVYPKLNLYGDTDVKTDTILFQQPTNNVSAVALSTSQIGFRITPTSGGYFTLFTVNLTSFGNRTITFNVYNGSGLGGSLLYTTSILVSGYSYGGYNSDYSIILPSPINIVFGNTYTIGLTDTQSGNCVYLYGITSGGSYVAYNSSVYPNSSVYTSNVTINFNQPHNDVISGNMSIASQNGYLFYPTVSGYLYTFSVFLSSFDTSGIRTITTTLIEGAGLSGTVLGTATINISNSVQANYISIAFDPQTIPSITKDQPYTLSLQDTTSTGNTTGFIRLFGIATSSEFVAYNTSVYPSLRLVIPQFIMTFSPAFSRDDFIGDGFDIVSFSAAAKDNASTLLYGGGMQVNRR